MKIRLLAVGTGMPAWVDEAVSTYEKRISHGVQYSVTEVPAGRRNQKTSAEVAMRDEAKALLAAVGNHHVVLLDERGKQHDSVGLSRRLEHWQMLGKDVDLVIGGADGFDPSMRERADESWSLSKLTLPHPMVRAVVTEQIYRAQTILVGHPYHRA